jgi:CheY-like chemotaxis protein
LTKFLTREDRLDVSTCLREAGYVVMESASGEEAIAICRRSAAMIDIVITDINLGRPAKCWDVAECFRARRAARLKARFAAVRVRTADGPPRRIWDKGQQHLPGDEAWLIGEHRTSGEKKYYLANLAAGMDLRSLAATIKARWICEQAHQPKGLTRHRIGVDQFPHIAASTSGPRRSDRFWGTGAVEWPSFSNAAEAALSNN